MSQPAPTPSWNPRSDREKAGKCLYVLIRAESVLVTTLIDLAGLEKSSR